MVNFNRNILAILLKQFKTHARMNFRQIIENPRIYLKNIRHIFKDHTKKINLSY